ncbi:MAG: MAE_28990/MAE_18760 family HEPN-like nuclease [Sphingomonadaceae bacterium]
MTPLQEIEKDLDWREAELAVLKILIVNEQLSDREKSVLYRASWTILYAHYEGFCKLALTVYYDAIQRSQKCHSELPAGMQALALDQQIKVLRTLPTIDLISQISTFEADFMDKTANFPEVNTDSNLWPSTLRTLLESAAITLPSLDANYRSIATLVSRRNKIAHGERDIIPEYSYYVQFEDAVRSIMYDLAISIDEKLKAF